MSIFITKLNCKIQSKAQHILNIIIVNYLTLIALLLCAKITQQRERADASQLLFFYYMLGLVL